MKSTNAQDRLAADARLRLLKIIPSDTDYCHEVAMVCGASDVEPLSDLMHDCPDVVTTVRLLGGPHAATIYKMLLARKEKATTDEVVALVGEENC